MITTKERRDFLDNPCSILHPSMKVYNFPQDLEILNEVNVNIQLFDFTPGEEKNLWANAALCSLLGTTCEQIQEMNLIDCSATLREWQMSLLQNIQIEKRTETSVKTISPGGKPISLMYTFRPITLRIPGKSHPRTVIFSTALPVNQQSKADKDLIMCQEMARYTDVAQMLVCHSSHEVLYSNQRARLLWPDLTDSVKTVTVQDILNSRVWASSEEKEAVLARYRGLTIHSAPFEVECRVPASAEPLMTWHRISFTPCICPLSGGPAVTINAVDTTKLRQQTLELEESRRRERDEAAKALRLLHAMIPERIISKIQHYWGDDEVFDVCSDDRESDRDHRGCAPAQSPRNDHETSSDTSSEGQDISRSDLRNRRSRSCDGVRLSQVRRPNSSNGLPLQAAAAGLWTILRSSSASSDNSCHRPTPDTVPQLTNRILQGKDRPSLQLDSGSRAGRHGDHLGLPVPVPVPVGCRSQRALYAEEKACVSIIFADVVGFSRISKGLRPIAVMDMLTDLFGRYDRLCDKHGVHKVETIGDGCLMAAGLLDDDRNLNDHPAPASRAAALRALAIAKDMIAEAQAVRAPRRKGEATGERLHIRVGVHVGPITCGVLGKELPRFDVFGHAVNVAARMEQYGRPDMVHVSREFHDLIGHSAEPWKEPRVITIKNMGQQETWLLDPTHVQ